MLCLGCVLSVDSIVMIVGLMFGILMIMLYIEFVVGVFVGGCIGFIVVVVGICFLLMMFFVLLVGMIFVYVMVGVILYVVVLMM